MEGEVEYEVIDDRAHSRNLVVVEEGCFRNNAAIFCPGYELFSDPGDRIFWWWIIF